MKRGETRCCSSATTGPRPITTSNLKTVPAGYWPGGGCPKGWSGSPCSTSWWASISTPAGEPDQVLVGIETERGPWVQALIAAGYAVFAINPLQVARYRERHPTSGAKSDPGDAHLLAEIVRLDRAHHRRVAGDSAIAEHIKVAARAHQTMIWSRVRQVNALREYYPAALVAFGTDLADRDALAILRAAPSPDQGQRLPKPASNPCSARPGGNATSRQPRPRSSLRFVPTVVGRPGVVGAYAASASALIAVLTTRVTQTEVLAGQVEQGFGRHPDVEIYRSQTGLGVILGDRVLAEFGDDPDRYLDARSRKNCSGMSPITRASGTPSGRAGPLRPEPPTGRRAAPAGLLRATGLTRSEGLLRPAPRPRHHPLSSPPSRLQPARRRLARLPTHPHPLRRTPRLAHRPTLSRRLNRIPQAAGILLSSQSRRSTAAVNPPRNPRMPAEA